MPPPGSDVITSPRKQQPLADTTASITAQQVSTGRCCWLHVLRYIAQAVCVCPVCVLANFLTWTQVLNYCYASGPVAGVYVAACTHVLCCRHAAAT